MLKEYPSLFIVLEFLLSIILFTADFIIFKYDAHNAHINYVALMSFSFL